MVKPVVKRPAKAEAENLPEATEGAGEQSLAATASVLFEDTPDTVTLRSGKVVNIQNGKTRHVGLLLNFFNVLVSRMPREQIVTLVSLIQERGAKGTPAEAKEVDTLVSEAFDKSSLFITLMQAVFDVLPGIIESMSNLTEDEYLNLDMDEGAAVAVAVFNLNYRFFSQNLPPVLRLFLAQGAAKVVGK